MLVLAVVTSLSPTSSSGNSSFCSRTSLILALIMTCELLPSIKLTLQQSHFACQNTGGCYQMLMLPMPSDLMGYKYVLPSLFDTCSVSSLDYSLSQGTLKTQGMGWAAFWCSKGLNHPLLRPLPARERDTCMEVQEETYCREI